MITATLGAGPAPASTAPDNREAIATRVFDAPRELVFEAMTNPEHVKRWYGPRDTHAGLVRDRPARRAAASAS